MLKMPFQSQAQRRLAYAVLNGTKVQGGMTKKVASEFVKTDKANPKRGLPDKVKKGK